MAAAATSGPAAWDGISGETAGCDPAGTRGGGGRRGGAGAGAGRAVVRRAKSLRMLFATSHPDSTSALPAMASLASPPIFMPANVDSALIPLAAAPMPGAGDRVWA